MFYFLINFFFKKQTTTTLPTTDANGKALPPHANIWQPGTQFELRVYITPEQEFNDFTNHDALVWHKSGLSYDWKDTNYVEHYIELPTPKVGFAQVLHSQCRY